MSKNTNTGDFREQAIQDIIANGPVKISDVVHRFAPPGLNRKELTKYYGLIIQATSNRQGRRIQRIGRGLYDKADEPGRDFRQRGSARKTAPKVYPPTTPDALIRAVSEACSRGAISSQQYNDAMEIIPLAKRVAKGLLAIAELAMPDTYLATDSRVKLAKRLLELCK